MRTLLFTGPGGAGTTTVATAAAVRAARSGERTLLLSRQRPRIAGLDRVAGLSVRIVEAQPALEDLWRGRVEDLAAVLPSVTLPPATSVVPLPGLDELALLAELARADADVVVVDAGPLERLASLLALPATLRWWLERVLPPRMRALGAVRTAAVRAGAVRRGPVDAALAAVPLLEDLIARAPVGDPALTVVSIVSTARRDVPPAVRDAATSVALHGQRIASVLVRLLPPGGPGEWWDVRTAEQDAVLPELAEIAEVVRLPELAAGPDDVDALAALLPEAGLPEPEPIAVPAPEKVDGGWRLVLPLPFAERGAIDLTRWEDDLVVTAGGVRRSLRLDALLRRCQVTAGRLVDGGTAKARLEVTFVPDPALWPADLLPGGEDPS